MLKIFAIPVAVIQSVWSICHISFGAGASKRRNLAVGRFFGSERPSKPLRSLTLGV